MFKYLFVGVVIILLNSYNDVNCDNSQVSQTDNDVFIIEQSIDTSEYKEIGKLNLRTIRQNQNSAQFQTMNSNFDESNDDNKYMLTNSNVFATQIESNDFDAESMDQILAYKNSPSFNANDHTIYRLRLCKKGLPGSSAKVCYTSTFTYLKTIIDSNMRINLTIYTGVNNFLNSMSIKTGSSGAESMVKSKKESLLNHLVINVCIQNMKTAVGPDTDTYLEKVKKEMEQKEKGAQGENQSFLSKYWIYIVPVMIVMFLMNLANPEGPPGASR